MQLSINGLSDDIFKTIASIKEKPIAYGLEIIVWEFVCGYLT